jgi:hypothetical protein
MPLRADYGSFNGGVISPAVAARLDVAKYHTALRDGSNIIVLPEGGVTGRPGFAYVGRRKVGSTGGRLIRFQFSTTQSYMLEFTDLKMRVIKNGGYVLENAKAINAQATHSPFALQVNAHGYAAGDEVFVTGTTGLMDSDGLNPLNARVWRVANPAANTFELHTLQGAAVDDTGLSTYLGAGTVARLYSITTLFDATDINALRFVQQGDVMYLVDGKDNVFKLSRSGDASWTLAVAAFGASIASPANVTASPHVVTVGTPSTQIYTATAIDALTGEESVANSSNSCNNDLSQAGNYNDVGWDAVTGASRYNVYKQVNGIYGYIGGTTNTTFRDQNITPDLGVTPPLTRDPFQGASDRPAAIGMHEQRLLFGGTDNKPNGVWTSQSGNYQNLNVSVPPRADDAVTFALVARQLNRVRDFVSLTALLAFTSDAVFKITGGSITDYLTPTSIVIRPASYRGAADVSPEVVDDIALYSEEMGAFIRSVGYQFQSDNYKGNNLSLYAKHLFKNLTIRRMAWAVHPFSCLFALRSDGVLLALTFVPEEDVFGWTPLYAGGIDAVIEDVACNVEGGEAVLYAIIARTINGVTEHYVERMTSPNWASIDTAVYADAAAIYAGAAATVIGGLEYLEGETVSILADAAVVPAQVVTGGKVRLSDAASNVAIGLGYRQMAKTLEPNLQSSGSQVGKTQKIGKVVLRLQDTRGLTAGILETGEMFDVKERDQEAMDSPPELFTGDVPFAMPPAWKRQSGVCVVQDNPLPFTLLGVFADVEVGGS